MQWQLWKGFDAWQAHTLRHRSAADLLKIMAAALHRWQLQLLRGAWAQWKVQVEFSKRAPAARAVAAQDTAKAGSVPF